MTPGRRAGRLIFAVSVATVAFHPGTASATSDVTVNPDIPATPLDLRRMWSFNSPQLAADPTEAGFMALASRMDSPDFSCALHLSGDGGRTWVVGRPLPKLPSGADKCYAPEVALGPRGTLHYLFVGLKAPDNEPMGVFLTTSTDRGRTFSSPRRVLGPFSFGVRMAIDPTIGLSGRIHLVWLAANSDPGLGSLPPPPNPIMATHSDDGGRTFSEPVQVSDPDRDLVVAPAVAVAPDGAVHVAYYDLGRDALDYHGLEGPVWEDPWSLVLASSGDAGRRFGRGVVVDEDVVPPERVMLIFTMAPAALAADAAGRVFAAWHDARNDDWDVFLRRSTDGGRSWNARQRLNDDRRGNGRHQYLPRLAVAPDGRVDAVFYDRRHDPDNLSNHVYYTFSSDGGLRFAANRRLTSEPSDSRIGQRYLVASAQGKFDLGSRLGLASGQALAVAAWTDTRNSFLGTAAQSVFTTAVELGGGDDGANPRIPAAIAIAAGGGLAATALARASFRRRRAPRRSGP